jgi:hypothetical protein
VTILDFIFSFPHPSPKFIWGGVLINLGKFGFVLKIFFGFFWKENSRKDELICEIRELIVTISDFIFSFLPPSQKSIHNKVVEFIVFELTSYEPVNF